MNKNIDLTTVGGRIKAKRIEAGMTQVEAADKLFIAPALYSHYENNRVDLKASVITEIAKLYGTTAGYLIDGIENNLSMQDLEIIRIFNQLNNDEVKDVAMEQIKILTRIKLNENK